MEPVNLILPESIRDYVQGQVAEGGYDSVSDYVSDLIQADRQRKAEERLEARLLEGLDSGEPIVVDERYWERKRERLAARFGEAAEGR